MKLQEQKEEELEACEAMLRDDVLMRATVTSTHDNMNTAQAALNVHTLCRICAEAGEHMEEIFGAAQLHTKINLCLPIKVCESDSLSLSVCHSCVTRLENSFELATLSQRSDVILRDLQQRQNKEQRQIQVQQQNEEQKHQPCDPIEHKVAVSQISAVNSPVSNMDLNQTLHHNSPPNSSTSSESENYAVKNYNLKPLSVQLTRLSQNFMDSFTVKVEQDVSESSQEQMRNDDTNLQDIKLEPQFSNTNENDLIEENHGAAGCDVRIKTEADESRSNLHYVPIDNEILQDEDPLQNEITSELILKSEHEWSDVEESRDNVHDISDETERQKECEIGRQVDTGHLEYAEAQVEEELNQHITQSHQAVCSFPCMQCSKSFKTKTYLKKHEQRMHSISLKAFKCDTCSKSFKMKYLLNKHYKVHSDVRPFVCKKCGASFKRTDDLLSHNKYVHSELRPFECEVCAKRFKSKKEVEQHMNVHNLELNFICGQCDKKFKSKKYLTCHIKRHNTLRPFPCTQCSKRFKTKYHLSQHMTVHSDVRPFSEICVKSFKTKIDFTRHGLVHSSSYDVKCNLCAAKFKRRGDLVNHMKYVHSDERPFQCNECDKLFKIKSVLRHHMAGHLNLRQFKCDKCDLAFNFKFMLKSHSIVHSDIFAFKCHVCEHKFKRKHNLKRHIFCIHMK